MGLLLALLPVIVILLLLTLRKSAADTAGMAGWLVTALVAWLYFDTAPSIVLRASVAGILASLPISIMVATSILQVTLMIETGAIGRVVVLIKQVATGSQVAQIMLVNMGFGTLLAALGATPVSILPPIMLALGYSSFVSIALPALGYDALCTYALLGVPVVVFSNFVGRPVGEVSWYFARFMPVMSSGIALGMLFVVGRWTLLARGLVPALAAGLVAGFVAIGMTAAGLVPITGVAAGAAVILAMLVYLKLTGRGIVAPYLGLLGGFLSGSESSAIAMLTAIHLSTAQQIGAAGLLVAAASGIGGGLASVISPAKLQNAAAAIDRIGEESQVIGTVFWIAVAITGVCAVMTLAWAF